MAGKHITEKKRRTKSRHNRRLHWMHTILLLFIGCILGVNLYLANARSIVGNQLPMPFGYGIANVLSGSMEPTFSPGTLLIVKETDSIEKGDIVVYQSGQSLVVHRVRALDGSLVVTQGDANNVPDDPFFKDQIKGKVIGWIPGVGTVAAVLRTPAAVILIIILAVFLLERSFRKEKEDDEQELDQIRQEICRLKEENERHRKK